MKRTTQRLLLLGVVTAMLGVWAQPAFADTASTDPPTATSSTVESASSPESAPPATSEVPSTETSDDGAASETPSASDDPTSDPDSSTDVPDTTVAAEDAPVDGAAPNALLTDDAPLIGESPSATTNSAPPLQSARTGTGTSTKGQPITVIIDTPADGALVPVGSSVDVTGRVTIGLLGTGISVAFVVDTSGSTSSAGGPAGSCGDMNGDGQSDQIIDCEIAGVGVLNGEFVGIPAVQSGLVSFNSTAIIDKGLTSPSDPTLIAAIGALDSGGNTNFNDALTKTVTMLSAAPSGNQKLAYFFSDGFPNSGWSTGPGSPLESAVSAGIVINTFSVGTSAAGCGPTSPLFTIADATGGECIEVDDPSTLDDVVKDLKPAGIDRVEVSLNGGPPVIATLDALGFFSATVSSVTLGVNGIVVNAFTDDNVVVAADTFVVGTTVPPEVLGETTTTLPTTVLPVVAGAQAVPVSTVVTSTSPGLAYTGSSSWLILLIGTSLFLGGFVLLGSRRRLIAASED